MAIERIEGSGSLMITGEHIELFRLLSLKGRLQLETKGLRFRLPTAPTVRELLGSKTRDKVKLVAELEAYIAEKFPTPDAGNA